jgi:hypothetical protein
MFMNDVPSSLQATTVKALEDPAENHHSRRLLSTYFMSVRSPLGLLNPLAGGGIQYENRDGKRVRQIVLTFLGLSISLNKAM